MSKKKWNLETIKAEALKYNTRTEFTNNSGGAYCAAKRMKILNDVCGHMVSGALIWTNDTIQEEALKYDTRLAFSNKSPGAYKKAHALNIIDAVCSHMNKVHATWNKASIQFEALKFSTKIDFKNYSSKAYQAACRNGIIDDVCSHMPEGRIVWDFDMIHKEALKYNTRTDFQKGSPKAHGAAREVMDEVCSHMTIVLTIWNSENITAEALKYEYRNEFQNNNESAYRKAMKLGILNDVCSHMKRDPRLGGNNCLYVWNIENTNIYKIGITSMKLGYARINSVASKHNVTPIITAYCEVEDAMKIENELHKVFQTPQDLITSGDGYTEFKTLTRTELVEVLDYLNQEKIEGVLNYPL